MPTIPPIALVFSARHDTAFIASLAAQWAAIPMHVVHMDGAVVTKRHAGFNEITKLNQLRAQHVVWIGVPSKWALNHVGASGLFKSHFVGASNRFARTKNSVMIERTVQNALDAMAAEVQKATEVRQKVAAEAVEERRRRRLGEAAAWFIPEALR